MPTIYLRKQVDDSHDSVFIGTYNKLGSELVFSSSPIVGTKCIVKLIAPNDDDEYKITKKVAEYKVLFYCRVNKLGVLVLEYINGFGLDLLTYPEFIGYFDNICRSICNLHDKGFVHGDITENNFILKSNNDVILIDFEFSYKSQAEDWFTRDWVGLITTIETLYYLNLTSIKKIIQRNNFNEKEIISLIRNSL